MSDKNNGGPAFPVPDVQAAMARTVGELTSMARGMTLRDYFAAKAMQALISEPSNHSVLAAEDVIARASYLMADAMLKAREQ